MDTPENITHIYGTRQADRTRPQITASQRPNAVYILINSQAVRLLSISKGQRVAIAKLEDGSFALVAHDKGGKVSRVGAGETFKTTIGALRMGDTQKQRATITGQLVTWPAGTFAEPPPK